MSTATSISPLETLQQRIEPLHNRLAGHPLFRSFRTIGHLHLFMESHVFAVWDFMSLLKSLQIGLTSVQVPWLPSADGESRFLINQIVLGEESDIYNGRHYSHFELYLEAMRSAGASTRAIDATTRSLANGNTLTEALTDAPAGASTFVHHTFAQIDSGKLHAIAAAFTFGREDLIPGMFTGFLKDLNRNLSGSLVPFIWYLERHVEVDSGEHGPMALQMVANLCGQDEHKWAEATQAAEQALATRLALWDSILKQISS